LGIYYMRLPRGKKSRRFPTSEERWLPTYEGQGGDHQAASGI
jgi:hypothetical protein